MAFRHRRFDGGVVGHWRRDKKVWHVSTFDPTRLLPSDWINIPRSKTLLLDVFGNNPTHRAEHPFCAISFRAADSPHMRRDTRHQGFLYYHIPFPARPLSGGLRFRSTPVSTGFMHGTDLLCPSGLPWSIPLHEFTPRNGHPVLQSLLRDNLVSFSDVIASTTTFGATKHPDLPVIHMPGQPWQLDLSAPAVILVPGPSKPLRCELYPPVARYGSALVCLERTENPTAPHELVIRVLELRSDIAFLPSYAFLPHPDPGTLLPHPHPTHTPVPWTWNDASSQSNEMAAALLCLAHGPGTSPLPSLRLRRKLMHRFYGRLPTDEELTRYAAEQG
ncbi:hypothetical protein GGX14DRAFT_48635 [Mycena pura]|uniref:Uncharacterized protein n=1 Tax=Mycena pura TaxID=153505 RepID=A0AAD6YF35_9AGAR|nr:hypothetical protein GGX14DRAFT_48635 [Mycena pura]